jgi:uncharacterized protein (UPF0371 family)
VEVFPVVKRIMGKITGGESFYQSPTDMGVNKAGFAIIDDEIAGEASRQEIIRRCFRYRCEYAMGLTDKETVQRVELFMKDLGLKPEDRAVMAPSWEAARQAQADEKGNEGIFCGAAIQLKDGTIITGNNSPLMHASSSLILNAIKHLADIPDKIKLLPKSITDSVRSLKTDILQEKSVSLDLEETLIALSISAANNPAAQMAIEKLTHLRGCEVHMTHIPTAGDEAGLRKLGVNLTTEPYFSTRNLLMP